MADPKTAALGAVIVGLVALGAAMMAQDGALPEEPIEARRGPSQAYALPLDASRIENWDALGPALSGDAVRAAIERDGFAIVENPRNLSRMVEAYDYINSMGIDPLVTTDASFHLLYVQFAQTWRILEGHFASDLNYVSRKMMDGSLDQYESLSDPALKDAALANAAFFAVGQKLVIEQPYELPAEIAGKVDEEVSLVKGAAGPSESPLLGRVVDYSKFGRKVLESEPHQERDPYKKYFRVSTWYESSVFGPEPDEGKGDIRTIQAVLMSDLLHSMPYVMEKWERVYEVTPAFLGQRGGLGPAEYAEAYAAAGPEPGYAGLLTREGMAALKAEIARAAAKACAGQPVMPAWQECPKPEGMRILRERAPSASGIFSSLTGQPYAGHGVPLTLLGDEGGSERGFYRGLDVMAAAGSERALEILEAEGDAEYDGYDMQAEHLQESFVSEGVRVLDRGSYWGWLWAVQSLLEPAAAGYPAFMQTDRWEDRDLQAALAMRSVLESNPLVTSTNPTRPESRAAAGEITGIQYIQPADPPFQRTPTGFGHVEPAAGMYSRLAGVVSDINGKIDEYGAAKIHRVGNYAGLQAHIERLADVSERWVSGAPLSQKDYEFMADFDRNLALPGGSYGDAETRLASIVHEDPASGQVLEEGTGYLDILIVAYDAPNGEVRIAAGPIFSYYEFRQEGGRLDYQEWRAMLDSDPPLRPDWASGLISAREDVRLDETRTAGSAYSKGHNVM